MDPKENFGSDFVIRVEGLNQRNDPVIYGRKSLLHDESKLTAANIGTRIQAVVRSGLLNKKLQPGASYDVHITFYNRT